MAGDSADREKIFHPLGRGEGAMSEQAVETHAEAEASGDPVENGGDEKPLPAEEEKCGDCAEVEGSRTGAIAQLMRSVLVRALAGCVSVLCAASGGVMVWATHREPEAIVAKSGVEGCAKVHSRDGDGAADQTM